MLEIAISPCPNDTYLFAPWILGFLGGSPKAHFADIEELNLSALEKRFPLIKVSFACPLEGFEILPVGAALCFQFGPKLIAKAPFPLEALAEKRIAIPGLWTTAHLLLKQFCPTPKEKRFCRFDQIFALLQENEVDAGLIIHESRFTFEQNGFVEIADLGNLWHEKFALPLPLGGLALQKNHPLKQRIIDLLQYSYDFAKKNFNTILPFILEKAQETKRAIVLKHIETYVNQETRELSSLGWQAIHEITRLRHIS